MRTKRRGWIMPEADIVSMLWALDERIGSPNLDVHRCDILIRLRDILGDDLSNHRPEEVSQEQETEQGAAA